MKNTYNLICLSGIFWMLLSLYTCKKQDIETTGITSNIDSILGQPMPMHDCGRELRDSFTVMYEKVNILKMYQLERERRQNMPIMADPGAYGTPSHSSN